ncbi:MAG: MraY family glycosyltransferase [Fimbriiglobus sp.]
MTTFMMIVSVCFPSFVCGALAVWLGRTLSRRVGLVDKPDGQRKLHEYPVAVCGGLGVLCGAVAGLGIGMLLDPMVWSAVVQEPDQKLALLVAMIVIAATGLVDDLINLRARHKMVGQWLSTIILVHIGGYQIKEISLFGHVFELGLLAYPLTYFWFLAAINAINLLDGMDGLLGTIALLIFGTLAGMAFGILNIGTGVLAVAMAGALLGFLIFNLPPASVYLGDCGSMLIGLVVATLAISSNLKGAATTIVVPITLLVIPILDTSAAIVRRKLTGRSMAVPDRGHYHHRLQQRYNRWVVLLITAGIGGIASAGALLATFLGSDGYSVGATISVITVLVFFGLFGRSELQLIFKQAQRLLTAFLRKPTREGMAVQLQGHVNWRPLWVRLVGHAHGSQIQCLRLDINAPAWHESFHGRWDRTDSFVRKMPLEMSRMEVPVFAHGLKVGTLTLVTFVNHQPLAEQVSPLQTILAEIESLLPPKTKSSMATPVLTYDTTMSVPA